MSSSPTSLKTSVEPVSLLDNDLSSTNRSPGVGGEVTDSEKQDEVIREWEQRDRVETQMDAVFQEVLEGGHASLLSTTPTHEDDIGEDTNNIVFQRFIQFPLQIPHPTRHRYLYITINCRLYRGWWGETRCRGSRSSCSVILSSLSRFFRVGRVSRAGTTGKQQVEQVVISSGRARQNV